MKVEIEFDDFYEDFITSDGEVIENVHFVRGRSGNLEFHTPVFEDDPQAVRDAKAVIFMKLTLEGGQWPVN